MLCIAVVVPVVMMIMVIVGSSGCCGEFTVYPVRFIIHLDATIPLHRDPVYSEWKVCMWKE